VFSQKVFSLDEVRYLSKEPRLMPGQPEPEWLRRNAAIARRLAELKREGVTLEAPPRLLQRLALVFGRG
jgi:hypothetical protein